MERAKTRPELKKEFDTFDIDLWYQTFSVTIAEIEEEGNSDMDKTGMLVGNFEKNP